jgi:hypothetical protein
VRVGKEISTCWNGKQAAGGGDSPRGKKPNKGKPDAQRK